MSKPNFLTNIPLDLRHNQRTLLSRIGYGLTSTAFWALSWLICPINVTAQSGFRYVNFAADATQHALGGQAVSRLVATQPLSFFTNPALLDSSNCGSLGLGVSPVYGQGLYTAAAYAFAKQNDSYFGVGFRGISYGKLTGTDAIGNPTTDFGAGNFLLTAAYARRRQYITFGGAAKLAGTFIDSYTSAAFLVDVGGIFTHPDKDLRFALTVRNMGVTLSRFTDIRQQLPFDILAGVSIKPAFMPLRFTFTADQLYQLNGLSDIANADDYTVTQQTLGHLSGGVEFLFHPKVTPLLGFNYRTAIAYQATGGNATAGLSFGLRFQHKKLQLAAARTAYLPQFGQWVFSGSWQL